MKEIWRALSSLGCSLEQFERSVPLKVIPKFPASLKVGRTFISDSTCWFNDETSEPFHCASPMCYNVPIFCIANMGVFLLWSFGLGPSLAWRINRRFYRVEGSLNWFACSNNLFLVCSGLMTPQPLIHWHDVSSCIHHFFLSLWFTLLPSFYTRRKTIRSKFKPQE